MKLVMIIKKECLETFRSHRWLWLPVFFLLLGLMQPLTSYFLSDILEQFGGLPEGAVIEIPAPSAEEVYGATLGQFTQLGTIVLVLAFMGSISEERRSGEVKMLLLRPVSYASYWFGKFIVNSTVMTVSFLLGIGIALFYIQLLFEPILMPALFGSLAMYWLWMLFIIAVTTTFSTLIKRQTVVAVCSLIVVFGMQMFASMFTSIASWTPGALPNLAVAMATEEIVLPIASTILSIILVAWMSVLYMKKTDWLY
ncbi:ABC transporter permease [Geomicrobium sp. JCM 19038]|uniref:ABC transporter permease n=1 Tax=Geomicrobium sp. JCM 19038 TaxID=1460635 RepID=UPI00045F4DA5|nr:ABC transporter permease subunit [Geomicrobium sp. JCM 19038]GAK08895.1 hypothetical protein JCM19038_2695 [Geomicrobium sp. JCM 19038]